MIPNNKKEILRSLPGVDRILELTKNELFYENIPKSVVLKAIREVIEETRGRILSDADIITGQDLSKNKIIKKVENKVKKAVSCELCKVVNATGIVLHTNLGRAALAGSALDNIYNIGAGYSNLEFDLLKGKRGVRYRAVQDILCEISGAQSAMVVNNNAAAVLLCLDTIAKGREVVISRGELIEIGGSFRIPDVIAKSGCILTEVGATNKTHISDYENAIDIETALFLKVHTSNYAIVGFTGNVELELLVKLGKERKIPVMEDLGSGTFIDFLEYGLVKEPTVQNSIAKGADIVTFSGDKLLGGPQAGIILGNTDLIDKIKKNPLTRALRIDKIRLAALETTLRFYRDPKTAVEQIPTLRMLCMPIAKIEQRALRLVKLIEDLRATSLKVSIVDCKSKAGGGSLPLLDIEGKAVTISGKSISAGYIEKRMRENKPPIIGRIKDGLFLLDLRTIEDEDFNIIVDAVKNMIN